LNKDSHCSLLGVNCLGKENWKYFKNSGTPFKTLKKLLFFTPIKKNTVKRPVTPIVKKIKNYV